MAAYSRKEIFPYVFALVGYTAYLLLFLVFFERIGWAIAPLTVIPVAIGSWYFGNWGGGY